MEIIENKKSYDVVIVGSGAGDSRLEGVGRIARAQQAPHPR